MWSEVMFSCELPFATLRASLIVNAIIDDREVT